jgi:hypothetical protein
LVSAVSSVDCERSFSRYNLIKTNIRNRLKFQVWCSAKDRRILNY